MTLEVSVNAHCGNSRHKSYIWPTKTFRISWTSPEKTEVRELGQDWKIAWKNRKNNNNNGRGRAREKYIRGEIKWYWGVVRGEHLNWLNIGSNKMKKQDRKPYPTWHVTKWKWRPLLVPFLSLFSVSKLKYFSPASPTWRDLTRSVGSCAGLAVMTAYTWHNLFTFHLDPCVEHKPHLLMTF